MAGNLIVSFLTESTDYFLVGSGPSWAAHVEMDKPFDELNFETIGTRLGEAIKSFFQFSVPTFKYNKFGKVKTDLAGKQK